MVVFSNVPRFILCSGWFLDRDIVPTWKENRKKFSAIPWLFLHVLDEFFNLQNFQPSYYIFTIKLGNNNEILESLSIVSVKIKVLATMKKSWEYFCTDHITILLSQINKGNFSFLVFPHYFNRILVLMDIMSVKI